MPERERLGVNRLLVLFLWVTILLGRSWAGIGPRNYVTATQSFRFAGQHVTGFAVCRLGRHGLIAVQRPEWQAGR